MALSSDLLSQFVKITKDDKKVQDETTIRGTVKRVGDKTYVQLDGSDLLTPVSTTADIKDEERVTVTIQNHTATVTGNLSSPSASSKDLSATAGKISEFEIIMAGKVTTEDLEAANATIESLRTKLAQIAELDVVDADINNLQAIFADLEYVTAGDIKAITAVIESIEAKFGTFTDISTEDLEALNAHITTLKGYTADFTYVSAEVLEAVRASIRELDAKKISAEEADLKYATVEHLDSTYANIDFSNIGEAAIDKFYAVSGIIDKVTISEGVVVKELVGVTISGDLIKANTIMAEKLVVRGSDGKLYKLSTDFSALEGVTPVEEDSIHGSNIIANSITAEQISVDDLVAFDATIGGFHITENALYSGVKKTVDNSTQGIYMDSEGQIAVGDSSNYLKYFKDTDGKYKLDISAGSIRMGSSNKSVEETVNEAVDIANNAVLEATVNLRIDSSRGTVFKNNAVSTVLSAVIYKGSKRITDIDALHAEFGNGAYLEWLWQRMGEDTFGTIVSTDSRIGNGGFTFTLSPDDVDTKVVFMCQLITD